MVIIIKIIIISYATTNCMKHLPRNATTARMKKEDISSCP